MKTNEIKTLLAALSLALLAGGCVTALTINTKDDPQELEPLVLGSDEIYKFEELEIDVPDEIADEDYTVTRVDIFADIRVEYIAGPLDARLYIGLGGGDTDLDDPARNVKVGDERVSQPGERFRIVVKSPALVLRALKQESFWVKAVIETDSPLGSATVVVIENVYLDIRLERETKGLLPFFYIL